MKNGYLLSPPNRRIGIAVKYPILAAVIFLGLAILFLISGPSSKSTTTGLLSIAIIGTTITLISFSLVHKKGGIILGITSPLSFYGIFYLLYYLLPYLLLFFTDKLPVGNSLIIALLLFFGYLAWCAGVKSSRVREGVKISAEQIGKQEAYALIILCIVCIGLVIYFYAWRTYHGIFFIHARHYEQELSIAASFRNVFCSRLQLPIILFLGLLSSVQYKKVASFSRRLLMLYGFGLTLILILSSQTRLSITALIFMLISMQMHRQPIIKLRYIITICSIALIMILFIQGVRMDSYGLASSDNQFIYAIKKSGADAVLGLKAYNADLGEGVIGRAGGSLGFLSTLIDTIKSEGMFLYGKGIASSLYSVVPRFIWPDKPAVIALDLVVQTKLGLRNYDATMGPIIQFYVEGGWLGVIIGYFSFGWLMGTLTKRAMLYNKIWVWIILFLVWSYISNLELELILGLITTVRNAFVVYLMYKMIFLFLRLRK